MGQQCHRRNRPQRPHVQQYITGQRRAGHDDVLQHRTQAGVGVHHRLWRAGGAAGVVQRRQFRACPGNPQRCSGHARNTHRVQRQADHALLHQCSRHVSMAFAEQQQTRAGIVDLRQQFARCQRRIQRHADPAVGHAAVIGQQIVQAGIGQQGNPLARTDAQLGQPGREVIKGLIELGKGQFTGAAQVFDRQRLRPFAGSLGKQCADVHAHHPLRTMRPLTCRFSSKAWA